MLVSKLVECGAVFMNNMGTGKEYKLLWDDWLGVYALDGDYDEPYVWSSNHDVNIKRMGSQVVIGGKCYMLQ